MKLQRNDSAAPRRLVPLLACALLLAAGLVQARPQAGDAPDRPVAAYANQRAAGAGPAPVARAGQARRIALGKLPAARLAQERAASADAKGVRPRIGFPRAVAALADSAAFAAQLSWETLADGGRVAAVSVESPEAAGLRIGLAVEALPRAATLRLYAQAERADAQLVTGAEILDTLAENRASGASGDAARTYWLPMVAGNEATLEIELPAGADVDAVRLALPRISHLFITPRQHAAEHATRRAASCNLDISCQPYLGAWIDYSKAVALMDFVDGGIAYYCSGTLLADRNHSFTPYFLSANHCIDSQTIANTLETTWFYRSAACNDRYGTFPGSKTVTGGATLLYNSAATDTSFMRLRKAAPEGAVFAGWLPALPARYTGVVGLHHPTGDHQKISFGFVSDYESCRTDPGAAVYCESAAAADARFLGVSWQEGITESGSSGSGLWAAHEDGNHYLVGQLYAGSSSCYATGTDTYGRFDLAYGAALKQWLNADGGAEYALTVNRSEGGTVAANGIDCGSDCTEVFAAGTRATLTATPASGYGFAGWGGACDGNAPTCAVTMSASRVVDAWFARSLNKSMPLTPLSGSLNSETIYALAVPAGAADLIIKTIGGSGDADMFVRRNAIPTAVDHDCVSETPKSAESCQFAAPAQGTYYVLLKGYTAYAGVTLLASYTGGPSSAQAAADCLFDWAERSYPDWFAPAGTASQTLAGYYLRHYAATDAYLGLLDGRIYYLGPLTDHGLADLGTLDYWRGAARCD